MKTFRRWSRILLLTGLFLVFWMIQVENATYKIWLVVAVAVVSIPGMWLSMIAQMRQNRPDKEKKAG